MEAGRNGHSQSGQGNGHQDDSAGLQAPLLTSRSKEDVGLQERPAVQDAKREAEQQIHLGMPVVMMGLLDFSIGLVSVTFVGRLGALPLAGAAMAVSFANVFGFAILVSVQFIDWNHVPIFMS
jgi:hypothetical protein